jgi:rRNA maturation endonuclease Nob1
LDKETAEYLESVDHEPIDNEDRFRALYSQPIAAELGVKSLATVSTRIKECRKLVEDIEKALPACHDCGHAVPRAATICPKCGSQLHRDTDGIQ